MKKGFAAVKNVRRLTKNPLLTKKYFPKSHRVKKIKKEETCHTFRQVPLQV